eukprot:CAMPEP_0204862522 /NCGR_PEP_ID=MMETSP1348-20121228/2586_1 /ASSEMBLY_ACC=CAM_ASM_000700 /TAXON_ID=215587 /ORGANISM="Aplanochytrium stocchinoi, Strain GSBS06" /LENGTH=207 /DNA_ID=CAMNT_0052012497 /DNA_START=321 /DNA_END=940 /DNA_ORIENTATION=-
MKILRGFTFPRADHVWRRGTKVEILWVVDGITANTCFPQTVSVRIELFWGSTNSDNMNTITLANDIPNTGVVEVNLAENLPNRKDYFLRLVPRNPELEYLQFDSEMFTIYAAPEGELIISTPDENRTTTSAPTTPRRPREPPINDHRFPWWTILLIILAILMCCISAICFHFRMEIKSILRSDNATDNAAETMNQPLYDPDDSTMKT